ncbi:DotA/TraY family protein [Azohydromonas lata]|uniref:DotA/TraY family protein n=1 Tax=Azohydromonas lata TaxID=45677 RepID=UPI00082F1199|nr:DotA/TraY family protein [Azohydromonas lata]
MIHKAIQARAALLLLTASFSIPAHSQTTLGEIAGAAQRSGDKSRQALVSVFGNVVNDPLSIAGGTDTVLAGIFMVTNATLLVIGGFIVCYQFLRKITQTAHDGTAFDQQKHILWGPIRILWGLASVVPSPNGWSLAQLLMLWGASIMGVGTANLAVDQAVSAFNSGDSMVMQPVMPSTLSTAQGLFEANLCMHGLNMGVATASQSGALIPDGEFVNLKPTANGFVLRNASFVCGGVDLPSSFDSTPASNSWFSSSIPMEALRTAHTQALREMQGILDSQALAFVKSVVDRQANPNASLINAESAIQAAAQAYEKHVNTVAATKQGDIKSLASKLGTTIAESGWWTLGAWYQTFAQANTKLSDAVAAKAAVYGTSTAGDPAILAIYNAAYTAYISQQSTTNFTPPIGTSSTADYSKTATGNEASKIIGGIFQAPGQRFVNWAVNINAGGEGLGQVNPLIKMKNLGDYTLGIADTALATYAIAKGASKLKDHFSLVGIAARVADFATGIGSLFQSALDALSPIIIILVISLFLLGGALSIYLPFVPFIVWFGAAINWLIVVGEAVIAAPLWAVTHLRGDGGDGLGNHSTHGWVFLLNVMVRPLLMVCGFFLGGAFLIAGGTLLNQLFGVGVANAQFDSITGLVSVIFLLAIYVSMATNLVHSCFNLIFIVPDQVINWIGGHASSALGRDDNDRMRHAVAAISGKVEEAVNRRLSPRLDGSKGKPRSGDGFSSR